MFRTESFHSSFGRAGKGLRAMLKDCRFSLSEGGEGISGPGDGEEVVGCSEGCGDAFVRVLPREVCGVEEDGTVVGRGLEVERGQLVSSGGGLTCSRTKALRFFGARPGEEDGG